MAERTRRKNTFYVVYVTPVKACRTHFWNTFY